MFLLKSLNKVCRKYDQDLWGLLRAKRTRINRLGVSFLDRYMSRGEKRSHLAKSLRVDIPRISGRRRRRSVYGDILDTRKKLCYYYGGLTKFEYRQLNKLASNKVGDFSANMLSLLELRLATVVYRMNFASTILESIDLILSGYILVNKEVVKSPSKRVYVGDIVEVHYLKKKLKYDKVVYSLLTDQLLVLVPKHLEVNYLIMCGTVIREPLFSDIHFPFKVQSDFFLFEYKGKF